MSNKKNAHQMDTDKPQPKREREVVEEDEEEEEEEGEQVSKVALAQEHLKDLPQVVRKRVKALENLQKAHSDIDRQYRDELDALERKYMALHAPLLLRRAGIVNGEIEPSEQDAAGYIADATAPTTDAKGVPLFWYHALCNNEAIRSLTGLNERDKEALAALRDISYTLLPRTRKTVEDKEITEHGFSLTFTFGENEFFSDATLTKTYHLTEDETGEPMFDRAEANKPQWKTGKNLTMRVIKKAVPRPKRGGKRATGAPQFQTVEEPCESFFQFFSPVQMPDPGAEMDPDEFDELTEAVQGDFEAGCEIRDAICPRAVAWFNGTAVEDDDDEDDWDEDEDLEDEEGDEDDEDEDDEDDEEEDERPKGKKGQAAGHKFAAPPGSNPAENPECKQQ